MELKKYLWKYGMTQTKFAAKCGLKRTSIGAYIRKYRTPNTSSAIKIYEASCGEVTFKDLLPTEFKEYGLFERKNDSDNKKICL